jgi:hypothetical protein
MAGKHCFVVMVSVLFSAACGETNGEPDPAVPNGTAGTTPGAGGSGAPLAGGGGTTPVAPGAAGSDPGQPHPVAGEGGGPATGGSTGGPAPDGYDYQMEEVPLTADLIVAVGQTVRVGPGTTFTASTGAKVQVDGMLIVEGTAAAPVRFVGAGASTPRSWHGIVVASGGYLKLNHVEIGGATYGIHALPGSDFEVDFAELGTSFKAAVVESDGSFDHTRFHASGEQAFSAVNEVTIDDVNGTLTILDSSPTVTNSTFDGSAELVDMIRVGGNSSPIFDHLHIKEAHCGIHANGGTNNSPIITNTIFEGLAYGLMVYATKPNIEGSVFLMNGNDIGFCFDATADNAPVLTGNYYSNGDALIDPSCFQIGTADPSPASAANPAAGPVGL